MPTQNQPSAAKPENSNGAATQPAAGGNAGKSDQLSMDEVASMLGGMMATPSVDSDPKPASGEQAEYQPEGTGESLEEAGEKIAKEPTGTTDEPNEPEANDTGAASSPEENQNPGDTAEEAEISDSVDDAANVVAAKSIDPLPNPSDHKKPKPGSGSSGGMGRNFWVGGLLCSNIVLGGLLYWSWQQLDSVGARPVAEERATPESQQTPESDQPRELSVAQQQRVAASLNAFVEKHDSMYRITQTEPGYFAGKAGNETWQVPARAESRMTLFREAGPAALSPYRSVSPGRLSRMAEFLVAHAPEKELQPPSPPFSDIYIRVLNEAVVFRGEISIPLEKRKGEAAAAGVTARWQEPAGTRAFGSGLPTGLSSAELPGGSGVIGTPAFLEAMIAFNEAADRFIRNARDIRESWEEQQELNKKQWRNRFFSVPSQRTGTVFEASRDSAAKPILLVVTNVYSGGIYEGSLHLVGEEQVTKRVSFAVDGDASGTPETVRVQLRGFRGSGSFDSSVPRFFQRKTFNDITLRAQPDGSLVGQNGRVQIIIDAPKDQNSSGNS